jgi:hypothetical protein
VHGQGERCSLRLARHLGLRQCCQAFSLTGHNFRIMEDANLARDRWDKGTAGAREALGHRLGGKHPAIIIQASILHLPLCRETQRT